MSEKINEELEPPVEIECSSIVVIFKKGKFVGKKKVSQNFKMGEVQYGSE